MFKNFMRFIGSNSGSKQNLKIEKSQRLREQLRAFSKPKKIKKMFRQWEFTNEAWQQQQQHHQQRQQQQRRPELRTAQQQQQHYRLVSYNILAQDLLVEHLYLYSGIKTDHLRWEHRLCCLQNELLHLNPDILCVQEMQFNHLKEFVCRLSSNRKLEYVFKKKTGHRTDGCAIIYDKAKFELLAEQSVEFYKPRSNLLNRENIALLGRFALRHEPQKQIIIATTHLLFNPRRQDVRVAQVEHLLEALCLFARKCADSNTLLPIILTGDFNSEPDTPPYNKLITPWAVREEAKQTENGADRPEGQSAAEVDKAPTKATKVLSTTQLALEAIDFGQHCASTYHQRWITVDYILRSIRGNDDSKGDNDGVGGNSSSNDLKVLSIYKLPMISNCEFNGKIPNHFLGSDHYLQAIEFLVV